MIGSLEIRLIQRLRDTRQLLRELAADPFNRVVMVDQSPWDLVTYAQRLQAAFDEDNTREANRLLEAKL